MAKQSGGKTTLLAFTLNQDGTLLFTGKAALVNSELHADVGQAADKFAAHFSAREIVMIDVRTGLPWVPEESWDQVYERFKRLPPILEICD